MRRWPLALVCLFAFVAPSFAQSPPTSGAWPPPTPAGKRTIAVVNNCKDTGGTVKPLWVAVIPTDASWTGKLLDASMTRSFFLVPGNWTAARIWARTDCTGSGDQLTCKTGDCNGKFSCNVSGSGAVNVVEMSLGQPGNTDYYDLSNIDGYNVPVSITKLRGNGSCGKLACTLDPTTFPKELQYKVGSSTYLYNITGAITDADFRNSKPFLKTMYDGWAAKGDAYLTNRMAKITCSPGTCGYPDPPTDLSTKYPNFPKCTAPPSMGYVVLKGDPPAGLPASTKIFRDIVPGQCSKNNGSNSCPKGFYCQAQSGSTTGICASCCGCFNPNSVAACCPEQPGRNLPPNKQCSLPAVHGGSCTVDGIPNSSNGKPYYQLFHTACPDSYSWQFDDQNSLASCTNDPTSPNDYLITFCPANS